MGEFTPFAVHDSRVSTSVVPGISSGYVPLTRPTVLETPTSWLYVSQELTGSHIEMVA